MQKLTAFLQNCFNFLCSCSKAAEKKRWLAKVPSVKSLYTRRDHVLCGKDHRRRLPTSTILFKSCRSRLAEAAQLLMNPAQFNELSACIQFPSAFWNKKILPTARALVRMPLVAEEKDWEKPSPIYEKWGSINQAENTLLLLIDKGIDEWMSLTTGQGWTAFHAD